MEIGSSDSFCVESFSRQSYVPKCFNKCMYKEGQVFQFRITQIYDPSKFWIVPKFKELELFQKYLFRFYYINRIKYKMPVECIEQDHYCMVFTDGGFYRGLIVGIPCDIQDKQDYTIFFIDYGMVRSVEASHIYYLDKKHAKVPHFVIRAALAGICPARDFHNQWTQDDVTEFSKSVNDKILIGVVINIDAERQVLEIQCRDKGGNSDVIHEKLIKQKRARYFHDKPENRPKKLVGHQKLQYAYLFPCHEAIESGKVPESLGDADYKRQVSPFSSVVERYYKPENLTKLNYSF